MFKVGITGGIGSGKSTVCQIFQALGIPVYNADREAKKIMNTQPDVIEAIKELLGKEAYHQGQLNRIYIAEKVFNDPEQLKQLNAIVHPASIQASIHWANQQKCVPYVIKEAALIFETDAFHYLDKVIGVSAPHPLRIKRTMDRDNVSREEVLDRMKNQISEEVKIRLCDYVVYNDGQQLLIPQVLRLHEELKRKAK